MLTHDEFHCHCLLQTWWYPGRSKLVLIWDSGELLSMGLPDSSHPDSDSWSYDGNSMAASSSKGDQSIGDADERTTA